MLVEIIVFPLASIAPTNAERDKEGRAYLFGKEGDFAERSLCPASSGRRISPARLLGIARRMVGAQGEAVVASSTARKRRARKRGGKMIELVIQQRRRDPGGYEVARDARVAARTASAQPVSVTHGGIGARARQRAWPDKEGAPASFCSGSDAGAASTYSAPEPLMNASKSGLITSACVVHMPCGNFG